MKLLVILIYTSAYCFSQGITNYGASISINTGTNIYIKNAGYTNETTGQIDNDGKIYLDKNWKNNGVNNVFINLNTSGEVIFSGTTNQEIGGTAKTKFENLTVNNGNSLNLLENTDIIHNLNLTSGLFDLKDKIASLGSTGIIQNESETNRVTATPNNTGTITAIYTLNNTTNYDPANLGIKITTNQGLADVTVVRGHKIQTGSYAGTPSSGVARYYEIPGIGKLDVTNINVNMEYWDTELNSLTEANIEGYHWVTEGSSSSWWTPLDGTINTTNNLFTTSGNPYGDYFTSSTWYGFTWSDKFTLGSKDTPLPIVLANISANCSDNEAEIKWTTSNEINNDYFTIEKSIDGLEYNKIAEIEGAGNSNSIINYKYLDPNNIGTVYYKLSQTDYDNTLKTYKVLSVNCKSTNNDIVIYPNPAQNYLNIKLPINNKFTKLIIYDIINQKLFEQSINDIDTQIRINTSNYKNGVYNIVLISTNKQITKQLIINK